MKSVLIFILLIVLIVCPPSVINREERHKRMYEIKKQMIECVLKNEYISEDLKTEIKGNNDNDLRKIFNISNLEEGDREIIRDCRTKFFEKKREAIEGSEGTFYGRYNITHAKQVLHKSTNTTNNV